MESALHSGHFQLALFGALTVPDMCAALADLSGETSQARYIAWWDAQLGRFYSPPRLVTDGSGPSFLVPGLDGATAYRLRCKVLHQHRVELADARLAASRILFVLPTPNVMDSNTIDDVLQLDLARFVQVTVKGVQAWLRQMSSDPVVRANRTKGLQFHPDGVAPFIVGLPMFG
jgi:hypothetical protein